MLRLERNLNGGGWLAAVDDQTRAFAHDVDAYRWLLSFPLPPASRALVTQLCTAAEALAERGYLWAP